jgi:hypothetical protein
MKQKPAISRRSDSIKGGQLHFGMLGKQLHLYEVVLQNGGSKTRYGKKSYSYEAATLWNSYFRRNVSKIILNYTDLYVFTGNVLSKSK